LSAKSTTPTPRRIMASITYPWLRMSQISTSRSVPRDVRSVVPRRTEHGADTRKELGQMSVWSSVATSETKSSPPRACHRVCCQRTHPITIRGRAHRACGGFWDCTPGRFSFGNALGLVGSCGLCGAQTPRAASHQDDGCHTLRIDRSVGKANSPPHECPKRWICSAPTACRTASRSATYLSRS
jgi:hypothetical protein